MLLLDSREIIERCVLWLLDERADIRLGICWSISLVLTEEEGHSILRGGGCLCWKWVWMRSWEESQLLGFRLGVEDSIFRGEWRSELLYG